MQLLRDINTIILRLCAQEELCITYANISISVTRIREEVVVIEFTLPWVEVNESTMLSDGEYKEGRTMSAYGEFTRKEGKLYTRAHMTHAYSTQEHYFCDRCSLWKKALLFFSSRLETKTSPLFLTSIRYILPELLYRHAVLHFYNMYSHIRKHARYNEICLFTRWKRVEGKRGKKSCEIQYKRIGGVLHTRARLSWYECERCIEYCHGVPMILDFFLCHLDFAAYKHVLGRVTHLPTPLVDIIDAYNVPYYYASEVPPREYPLPWDIYGKIFPYHTIGKMQLKV